MEQNKKKRKELSKEEKGERSEWSQLPDDLLYLITRLLRLKDCLKLRAVCLPWRNTINDAIANSELHLLPTPPLIMLKHYRETSSLSLNSQCAINLKGPPSFKVEGNKICYGTVEGWLVMSDKYSNKKSDLSFFFLNPVTGAGISVPPKLNFPSNSPLERKKLGIWQVMASSKPQGSSSTCFLVVQFNDFCHIAFCRLSDESWTMIKKEDEHPFNDVGILGSKLYIRTNVCIQVYDLQDSSPKLEVLTSLPIIGNPNPVSCEVGYIVYMARDEALGELYLIYMKCCSVDHDVGDYSNVISEFNNTPRIVNLEVFKLCLVNETNQFVKIDNLGEHVMFLDGSNNMVKSSANFNHTEKLIAANCIYFAVCFSCRKDPRKGFQLGVFSLSNNKIMYYDMNIPSEEFKPTRPMWFSPSLV